MSNFNIQLGDGVARELYGDLKEIVNAVTYLMVTECLVAPGQYISKNADTNLRRAVENYLIYGFINGFLGSRDYVLKIPYLTLDEMGSSGKNTIDRLTSRARSAVKTYDIDLSGCATLEQVHEHVLGLYDACVKRQEQAEELEQMRRNHEVSKIEVAPAATVATAVATQPAPQAISEQELDHLEELADEAFEQEPEQEAGQEEQAPKAVEVEQEEELAQDELEGDAHKQIPLVVEGMESLLDAEQAEEVDDTPFDGSDIEDGLETDAAEEVDADAEEDDFEKQMRAILAVKNQ